MPTYLLPPDYSQQEFNDAGGPLAGGLLYTYVSGTTTPQVTYQVKTGTVNANPIVLNSRGEYSMRLDQTLEYTLVLKRADLTTVWTKDNIVSAAAASGVVTSVNSLTGAVSLTAALIPFTTATATTWFVGANTAAALDSIITHVDSAVAAGSVSIADAANYFTGTSVEAALQELGARTTSGLLIRTSFFTSNGTLTKSAGCNRIECEGTGGGGGAAASAGGGGGGGAGGYFFKAISSPAASYAVTVGAGGTAAGGSGGSSTMAGCTANGGAGAPAATGGAGGTATGGDLNQSGGGGGFGGSWSANVYFGGGGNSVYGGSGAGDINNGTGHAGAPGTGGGASGGTATGAAGGSGVVVVREYS